MALSISEQLQIVLRRTKVTKTELARRLNTTAQNLNGKFRRDNWTEADARAACEALGCQLRISIILPDGTDMLDSL